MRFWCSIPGKCELPQENRANRGKNWRAACARILRREEDTQGAITMMKRAIMLFLLLTAGQAFAEEPSFAGMEEWGAALIGKEDSTHIFELYQDGNEFYLVLRKITGYQDESAVFEYRHHVQFSMNAESHVMAYTTCERDKKPDSHVAAIAEFSYEEYLEPAIRAWTANLETEKIEEISVDGIRCVNDANGL